MRDLDLGDRLREARAILCDIDGVLTLGGRPAAGASEFVQRAASRLVLVSNNSTESPDMISERLRSIDILVPATRIVLAGWEAMRVAGEMFPGARAFVLGTSALRRRAELVGLQLAAGYDADLVVLARDLELTYDRLATAFDLVARGRPLIVGNPDLWHPGADGARVMETGALLAALGAAGGASAPIIVGKPEPPLFHIALERMNCCPDGAVMIGDNPHTDILGADRIGIFPILLGPQPTAAASSIAEILARHVSELA